MADTQKFLNQQKTLFDEQDEKGYRSHWRELRDNLLPDRGRFLSQDTSYQVNDGTKKRSLILTSVAENAVSNLAAGLKSYLTTPSRPWFKLRPANQRTFSHDVQLWLDEVEEAMHRIFNKSNFYEALHNTYIEFAGFGTGCMLIEEDPVDIIRCKSLTIGEYAFTTDHRGRPNKVVRRMFMTAMDMVEKFGEDNVSSHVKELYEKGNYTQRMEVWHMVWANTDRLPKELKPSARRPYASVYWEKAHPDKVLSKGSFNEMPYIIVTWNVISNDTYGSECPGMKELSNIKQLYDMQEQKLIAVHKVVEPPVVANGPVQSVNTQPGGISYAPGVLGGQMALQPLYLVKPDLQAMNESLAATIDEIRTGFFNHLFLMIADSEADRKTAFEVARLQEEKMSMLGPMIERLNTSGLDNAIERCFNIIVRDDVENLIFPPPPDELEGTPLDIEYISILAQAQKTTGLRSIDSFMLFVAQAAQLDPSVLENVNFDESIRYYQDGTGAPAIAIYSREEVAQKRQAREQQQAMANTIAATQEAAKAAKDLGGAELGKNTALDAVLAGGAENLGQ